MKKTDELGTVISTDVLILGAGGAGMCAALKARERGADVLLLDKCGIGWNGQVPIGGGILAYVYPDWSDEWAGKVTRDSNYFNNQDWTNAFGKEMHRSTMELADMGITFLKDKGDIKILNWGKDIYVTLFDAPKSLIALKKTARGRGVKMMDKIYAIDLLQRYEQVIGAVGFGLVDGKIYIFNAKATIIATGGCGYLHEKTYSSCLGEGPAMGFRAGAQLINSEFGSGYVWGTRILGKEFFGIRYYLYLENAKGEKIIAKHYPELMTGNHAVYTFDRRVIDSMYREVKAGLGPIYLNVRNLTPKELADLGDDPNEELEHIMANDNLRLLREKAGIDPVKEKIEMSPKYLYSGGGLRVDLECRTTLDGLWAAGSSCNNSWSGGGGMQGGLGVQSAAVTGFKAGESAAEFAANAKRLGIDFEAANRVIRRVLAPMERTGDLDPADVAYKVHEAVVPMKYNRQREAGRMTEALAIIQDAKDKLKRVGTSNYHDLARYHSAESMAMAAEYNFRAALMREESRHTHFREDFPYQDDKNWFKWITIEQKDGSPNLSTLPIPLDKYKLKPKKSTLS